MDISIDQVLLTNRQFVGSQAMPNHTAEKHFSSFVYLCCALSRAFGKRRFKKFIRGNRFLLLLVIPLSLTMIIGFLHVNGFFNLFRALYPPAVCQLLPPGQLQIAKVHGYPWHAIDPAGDLIPIITNQEPRTWAIWSLSRKRAIAHGMWEEISMRPGGSSPPTFLFSATRNEILVSIAGTANILALDASTGELKQVHAFPLSQEIVNLSPDGRSLLAKGLAWHDIPGFHGNELFFPVILDLETGKIQREAIRVNDCYFETNNTIICLRDYDVLRFDLRTRKMVLPFLAREEGDPRHDAYPRFGNSFMIDQSEGQKILFEKSVLETQQNHNENWTISLDGAGRIKPHQAMPLPFNREILTSGTRIVYSCEDTRFKTAVSWKHNLVIVRKEEYKRTETEGDSRGMSYGTRPLKRTCYLGELRSGRLYALYAWKDENDQAIEPRFVNDDTIGMEREKQIEFVPVQGILTRGPVE